MNEELVKATFRANFGQTVALHPVSNFGMDPFNIRYLICQITLSGVTPSPEIRGSSDLRLRLANNLERLIVRVGMVDGTDYYLGSYGNEPTRLFGLPPQDVEDLGSKVVSILLPFHPCLYPTEIEIAEWPDVYWIDRFANGDRCYSGVATYLIPSTPLDYLNGVVP